MSWVTQRSECSLRHQFEAMKQDVEQAVGERNSILQETVFTFLEGARSFTVESNRRDGQVRFTRESGYISINAPGLGQPWHVRLSLSPDHECVFTVRPNPGSRPLSEYLTREDVIRLALESWFFDGFPNQ